MSEIDRIMAEAIGWTEIGSHTTEVYDPLRRDAYWGKPPPDKRDFQTQPIPAYSTDDAAALEWIKAVWKMGIRTQVKFIEKVYFNISVASTGVGDSLSAALTKAVVEKYDSVEFTNCISGNYNTFQREVIRLRPAVQKLLEGKE